MRRSQLANIFFVVFIVMLGFGLIMPLLPYFAAQYGGGDFLVGLLVASYAAAQFVGAPVLGRLSDRHGRRLILAISGAAGTWAPGLLGATIMGSLAIYARRHLIAQPKPLPARPALAA